MLGVALGLYKAFGFWFPSDYPGVEKWIEQAQHLDEALAFVENWDVAIDVGAFAGVYTRRLSQRFKRVYAIEPNQTSFECLCMNTMDEANVVRIHAAAADTGDAVLRIQRKAWPSARVAAGDKEKDWMLVPPVTLDRLTDRAGFLKIDVEGYEYRVLRGADHILKHRPVVMIENKKHYKRYRDPNPVEYLQGLGMEVVWEKRPDVVLKWR